MALPVITHGQVMRGIKTNCGEVAECSDLIPTVGGSHGIATVFDQPEFVLSAKCCDGMEIERVSERVRQHHGPGARGARRLELGDVHIVGGEGDVHKNRY